MKDNEKQALLILRKLTTAYPDQQAFTVAATGVVNRRLWQGLRDAGMVVIYNHKESRQRRVSVTPQGKLYNIGSKPALSDKEVAVIEQCYVDSRLGLRWGYDEHPYERLDPNFEYGSAAAEDAARRLHVLGYLSPVHHANSNAQWNDVQGYTGYMMHVTEKGIQALENMQHLNQFVASGIDWKNDVLRREKTTRDTISQWGLLHPLRIIERRSTPVECFFLRPAKTDESIKVVTQSGNIREVKYGEVEPSTHNLVKRDDTGRVTDLVLTDYRIAVRVVHAQGYRPVFLISDHENEDQQPLVSAMAVYALGNILRQYDDLYSRIT